MAYPSNVQYPAALVSTQIVADPMLQSHVFNSGLAVPEVSNILSIAYPQYFLTGLLDLVGAKEAYGSRTYSWFEQDRTRNDIEVSSLSSEGSATITVTPVAGDVSYAVVGDIFRTTHGTLGLVTTVTAATSFVMTKIPSGTWLVGTDTTDDLDATTHKMLGHIGTSFEEGSAAPKARAFRPAEKYNFMHIARRTASVSGSELATKTWLGEAWFYQNEALTAKEFKRDIEGVFMFGEIASANGSTMTAAPGDFTSDTRTMTRGVWDYVFNQGGQLNTYASASGIQEADLIEMAKDLKVAGSNNEITCLAGSDAFVDVQVALKDYVVDGSASYGSFGSNIVGLDFVAYKFFGIKMNLVHYEMFDDAQMLPWDGANAASSIDFKKAILFLDLGIGQAGEPLVSYAYRKEGDTNRDAVYGFTNGMTGKGNSMEVNSGDDRYDSFFLAEFGAKVRLTHRHGILYANS
jgi:hypothetical protein